MNDRFELVSVIMGTTGADALKLERSIASVLAQSYQNIELIICKDGTVSPESEASLYAAQEYDSRVRVIEHNENMGLAQSLNDCIALANGLYIARQDDDDISDANRISLQVKFLEEHQDVPFVGSQARVFDDRGVWGHLRVEERPSNEDFLWNSPFLHPTVVFRRDALNACGGYRVSWETQRCEDYDLFMRLFALGYRGQNISDDTYSYWMDRSAAKHRDAKTRLQESIVRAKGFSLLGLGPLSIPYIIKPLLISLIPMGLYQRFKVNGYAD